MGHEIHFLRHCPSIKCDITVDHVVALGLDDHAIPLDSTLQSNFGPDGFLSRAPLGGASAGSFGLCEAAARERRNFQYHYQGMSTLNASIPGFSLPALSSFDPALSGEGSLDPMGLAAISDALANDLVPGITNRMSRPRFVTAIAVGALATESLFKQIAADGASTPSICFEWLVIEGFARSHEIRSSQPRAIPGIQKARIVIDRNQRLSLATYLKVPSVFGFTGVYKPFAIDSGIIDRDILPAGDSCFALVEAWERRQKLEGFATGVSGTDGGRLRARITDAVRTALREKRCSVPVRSDLFGILSRALNPDTASKKERKYLRSMLMSPHFEHRTELARLILPIAPEIANRSISEADAVRKVKESCSPELKLTIERLIAFEEFSSRIDLGFRNLCTISAGRTGSIKPKDVSQDPFTLRCAAELPELFRRAADVLEGTKLSANFLNSFAAFDAPGSPSDLMELFLVHHSRIQENKPPGGKRSWFEEVGGGWMIRPGYDNQRQDVPIHTFVHPIRISALARFLIDTEA